MIMQMKQNWEKIYKIIDKDYGLNSTLEIYYDIEYTILNLQPIMSKSITIIYIDSMRNIHSQHNMKTYKNTYFALNTIGFRE